MMREVLNAQEFFAKHKLLGLVHFGVRRDFYTDFGTFSTSFEPGGVCLHVDGKKTEIARITKWPSQRIDPFVCEIAGSNFKLQTRHRWGLLPRLEMIVEFQDKVMAVNFDQSWEMALEEWMDVHYNIYSKQLNVSFDPAFKQAALVISSIALHYYADYLSVGSE